jgi:translation elongation factor EF-Ts
MKSNEGHIEFKVEEFVRKSLEGSQRNAIIEYCNSKGHDSAEMLNYIETIANSLLDSYISDTNELNESFMNIEKAMEALNYKDFRSVVRWCKKNGVFIFEQGKRHLISKAEFLASFHKPFMEHLRSTHKNWKEIFEGFIKGQISLFYLTCLMLKQRFVLISLKASRKNHSCQI